ncbi:hypothetical protein [Pseudactinotalea sp. Z1732]
MSTWDATRAMWQAEKERAMAQLAATPAESAYDQQRDRLNAFIRSRDKRLALVGPGGIDQ